jgi:hypothetical protein
VDQQVKTTVLRNYFPRFYLGFSAIVDFVVYEINRACFSSPVAERQTQTTTPTTTMTPITLHHGQEIRVAGFSKFAQRITVGTARGYAAQYNESPEAGHARAIANGHETAWANQDSACLTDDYLGKAEELEAKASATASAPEIEHGQTVEIEGEIFRVIVAGERYSDPVHFRRVA